MKKRIVFNRLIHSGVFVFLLGAGFVVSGQNKSLGVGTATPSNNAALHVESPTNNQGVFLPRLTTAQRTAMTATLTAADKGLVLYDSDLATFFQWDGTAWKTTADVAGGPKLQLPYKDSIAAALTGNDLIKIQYNNASPKRMLRLENLNSANPSSTLSSLQLGTGFSGYFQVNNAAAGGTAVYGTTNSNLGGALAPVGVYGESTGTGSVGGAFRIFNPANTFPALYSNTTGTGPSLSVNVDNAASTAPAIAINHAGTGNSITANGRIQAASFAGDGSALTNLPPLTLPFSKVLSNTDMLTAANGFDLRYNGDSARTILNIHFSNAANTKVSNPVRITHDGQGAGFFLQQTSILGTGGIFQLTNAANPQPGVRGTTVGSGPGVQGINTGVHGNAGQFLHQNAANDSSAVYVNSFATAAPGVKSINRADAPAVVGINMAGTPGSNSHGVFGKATTSGLNNAGVYGTHTAGGPAVMGETWNSFAPVFGYQHGNWGWSGNFEIDEPTNGWAALFGHTTGWGPAGVFNALNPASDTTALLVQKSGNSGPAIRAINTNPGFGNAIEGIAEGPNGFGVFGDAKTTGFGIGVLGYNNSTGGGYAGSFEVTNPSNTSVIALKAAQAGSQHAAEFQITNAGSNSNAVNAWTLGTGTAVTATTPLGWTAVFAQHSGASNGHAGKFEITNGSNGWAALSASSAGTGEALRAENTSGGVSLAAYKSPTATGPALDVSLNNTGESSNAANIYSAGNQDGLFSNLNSATSPGTAIKGRASGTSGGAGAFEIFNGSNNAAALYTVTQGTGNALSVSVDNPGNTLPAIQINHSGSGAAINTSGKIQAGQFQGDGSLLTNLPPFTLPYSTATFNASDLFSITNTGGGNAIFASASNASAIRAEGSGTATVYAENTGSGDAISASATSATAVNATNTGSTGHAGFFTTTGPSNSNPSIVVQSDGTGPSLRATKSNAASNGHALEVNVQGGGGNISPAVFIDNSGGGSALQINQNNNGVAIDINSGTLKYSTFVTGSSPITTKAGIISLTAQVSYSLGFSAVNGESIFVLNDSGGAATFNGVPMADQDLFQFIYIGGIWRQVP